MANWYVAPALRVLIAAVNAAAPTRSKSSDGTIGDAAHAASKSEHNPNAQGAVRAWDCTHDPARGVDCGKLAEDVIDELDRRGVKGYVIFRGRIRSTYVSRGVWRRYSGSNPHNHHMHVSIITGWDSRAPWSLPSLTAAVTTVIDPGKIAVDGDLGPETMMRFAAVVGLDKFTPSSWWKAAQKWAGLCGEHVDGVPGPVTWAALKTKTGASSSSEDAIVTALQGWLNKQPIKTTPAKSPVPAWRLPKGHLIGSKTAAGWHRGGKADPIGASVIKAWQTQMKARGWTVTVNGMWGPQSEGVLSAFQAEKGLGVDGILGPQSWRAAFTAPVTR